ncbi:MAG: 1,4-alpha-glucan branching protein GlgB [Planctomycetales bacterium]|nr:1,4-alpha-glucan branching protein GlgB [Planctomycetales bacterium]
MRTQLSLQGVSRLVDGTLENPAQLLGPHPVTYGDRKAISVRAYLPDSEQVWLVDQADSNVRPMRRVHPSGFYEAICPADSNNSAEYRLRIASKSGEIFEMKDPYAVAPLLTEFDLYLFGQGRNWQIYNKMGAHSRTVDGTAGVNFAVWAPNAETVQVVGDFNHWDGQQHPMRKHIPAGVWELFVPNMKPGEKYKFRVRTMGGSTIDKTDPFGFYAEMPPRTASIVTPLDTYQWQDENWLERRASRDALKDPINIYELHLGSWRRDPNEHHGWMNYRKIAHQLVDYCTEMGFTHVELMPISEHPFTGSWGYQTVGYYGVTSRYGTSEDFMYFVDYCHQNGIGVILDWVPAHFPKDGHGLRQFDGSALYEHADPRQGEHPDWGTMIFNYGRDEVRNFLVANALFWLDKYHIDGLRVDAVASMIYLDYSRNEGEWIPNHYGGRENLDALHMLREFNEQAHAQFPGILTLAEESTAWPGVSRPTSSGGLGFSIKWNMGWMNDTLRYMRHEPIHRQYHHDELTFSLIYAFTENFALPLSHDEVVHGKGALISQMSGDLWQKFANLRLLYSYMWSHPGKKLLFMGSEIAQWHEWDYDSEIQWDLLSWETHSGIKRMLADLNHLVIQEPALHEVDFSSNGFEWIDCMNRHDSVISFIRRAEDPNDFLIVACNFTPVVREGYLVGVPQAGSYREIFNSDSKFYAGSNVGNYPGCTANNVPHHGRPASMKVNLPPLATVVLKPQSP